MTDVRADADLLDHIRNRVLDKLAHDDHLMVLDRPTADRWGDLAHRRHQTLAELVTSLAAPYPMAVYVSKWHGVQI